MVTVTATLPGESGPVPVAIYAQPDGGTEMLVATGTIVGGGSFSTTAHLERHTRVRVVRTDRPTTSSPAKTVTVRAQMVLELSASPAMSGATHVYPVAGDASAIGMVAPIEVSAALAGAASIRRPKADSKIWIRR